MQSLHSMIRTALGLMQRKTTPKRPALDKLIPELVELERRELLAADVATSAAEIGAPQSQTTPVQQTHFNGEATEMGRELIVIDAAVENPEVLLEGLGLEGLGGNAEVVILDADRDGLTQITEALSLRGPVRALHLVAHGSAGKLLLAGQTIDHEQLEQRSTLLHSWRDHLTDKADVFVYGCATGAGNDGDRWMQALAKSTGADIAASDDLTGSRRNHADWVLEKQLGQIEHATLFTSSTVDHYGHTLTITIRAAGGTGTENMSLLIDGVTVANFNNVGGNIVQRQFQTFTYNNLQPVTANRIQVAFTNDLFTDTIDRNLRVDSIAIDGRVFETEAATVYSTGTWEDGVGILPGFKQSEFLNVNGTFQYDATNPPKYGVIGWETNAVLVDESSSSVELKLTRSGGSDGTVSVNYRTLVNTANVDDFTRNGAK